MVLDRRRQLIQRVQSALLIRVLAARCGQRAIVRHLARTHTFWDLELDLASQLAADAMQLEVGLWPFELLVGDLLQQLPW